MINFNSNKMVVSVMLIMTLAVFVLPGSASAITAEELRAQINSLLSQISSLQSQLAFLEGVPSTGGISGCSITSFTVNFGEGSSGEDVRCLQVILNSDPATRIASAGPGSPGNETRFFGALTKAAVIKFQEKYASEILSPLGLSRGTGFIGQRTRDKLADFILPGGIGGPEPTPTPVPVLENTVGLAIDTPESSAVAKGAQDVIFAKVGFTGGSNGVNITRIAALRSGVSQDSDLSDVKIFDGVVQLGSTQAINNATHKATFSGFNFTVPAGTTKFLTIKGSVSGSATVGNAVRLGIASANDIVSSVPIFGSFPIFGNSKTIAGLTVGRLDVDRQTTPAAATILSGSVNQEIASWRFNAGNEEGFLVNSIRITQAGTASLNDISNIRLQYAGTQIAPTVAQLDSRNAATFDLSSAPLSISAGSSKAVVALADIASGISTARTVIFEITLASDVTAYGANSGGIVTVTSNSGQTFTRQTGNTMTVGQGALTIATDVSSNPSAQTYVRGTTNRAMLAMKFTAGSSEGVRATRLIFTQSGSALATDVSNLTLWDGSVQVAGSSSQIGSTVTFGFNTIGFDTAGLFDVAAGQSKTITLRADISNGATAGREIRFNLASADVSADGLLSRTDIPSTSIIGSAAGSILTVGSSGSLAISLSSASPAAQTYVVGATEREFTRFNLTAGSGEDILVTSITADILSNGSLATASNHLTNVKLVRADTGAQFGSTFTSPSGTASFSGSLIIPASQTIVLRAIADIPTSNFPQNNTAISVVSGVSGGTTIANAVRASGASSGANILATGSAVGRTITMGLGTFTVAAAPTPSDQTVAIGTPDVPLVGIVLIAGTSENVKVTSMQFTMSTVTPGGGASASDLSNVALYDGSIRLTARKALDSTTNTVRFSASDFLNLDGITINQGQQKVITVRGDIPGTAVSGHVFAIGIGTAGDIVASGLLSNTTISATLVAGPGPLATGVNFDSANSSLHAVTVSSQGTLAQVSSSAMLTSAIQAVGGPEAVTGLVEMNRVDFRSSLEDFFVQAVRVTRSSAIGGTSRDADFGLISLWDGSVQIGSGQFLTDGSTTFNLPVSSYWLLPRAVTKTLTVKAQFNGIAISVGNGSHAGDAPLLSIDSITAQGVSSGQTVTNTNIFSGNPMYLRQSKPVLAPINLPSSVLTVGEKVFYRWTVSADSKGDIGWKAIAFNFSGTLSNGDVIGGATNSVAPGNANADGVYIVDSAGNAAKAINDFEVWDITNNTRVTATATDSAGFDLSTNNVGAVVRWDTDAGNGANVIFIANSEEAVAAGQTKTYELRGTILGAGAPAVGDTVLVRVADLSSSNATGDYDTVIGSNNTSFAGGGTATTKSFIWNDRSGASSGNPHSVSTADWADDFKISGIPLTTLSLAR